MEVLIPVEIVKEGEHLDVASHLAKVLAPKNLTVNFFAVRRGVTDQLPFATASGGILRRKFAPFEFVSPPIH